MYNLILSATLDSRNLAMPNVFNNGHVAAAIAATVLLSREEYAHRKKKIALDVTSDCAESIR